MTGPGCSVLRCQQPGTHVHAMDGGQWQRRVELLICADHQEHIAGGGAWRYTENYDGHQERMLLVNPSDLVADGSLLAEGYPTIGTSMQSALSSEPQHKHALKWETRRWGRDSGDETVLMLTDEQARVLHTMLGAVLGADPTGPGSTS